MAGIGGEWRERVQPMEPLNPGTPAGAPDLQPPESPSWAEPIALDPGESELVVVLTTEANEALAERLATTLLERGLVACASLWPIVSHYRWRGQATRGAEVQLLLKTHPLRLEDLHAAVMALHSYDTPEWITLPGRSRGGYGLWCAAQLAAPLRADVEPPAPPRSPEDGGPAG